MSKKVEKIVALRTLCELCRELFTNSKLLNQQEIDTWLLMIEYSEGLLSDEEKSQKFNSYQLSTIENELLKYWNNYLNHEVEYFWQQVEKKNLPVKRNATFESIIEKQRFKNVEQAIDVYNDIFIRPIDDFNNQQLRSKLDKLYEIIKIDRDKRLKQFRKWIKNEKVSNSDRGKFGENYAYIKRTGQFDEIFGSKEKRIIEELSNMR